MSVDQPLDTRRLNLRSISAHDLGLYRALYSDAETMRHIGVRLSHDDAAANLSVILESDTDLRSGWRIWVIHDRQAGLDAGIVGLHVDRRAGEIGVMLQAPWRGCGIAAETIEAICRHAFAAGWIDTAFTQHAAAHGNAERLMRKLTFTRSVAPSVVRWQLQRPATDTSLIDAVPAVASGVFPSVVVT